MRLLLLLSLALLRCRAADVDEDLDVDLDVILNLDPIDPPSVPVVYKTAPAAEPVTSSTRVYRPRSAADAAATAVFKGLEQGYNNIINLKLLVSPPPASTSAAVDVKAAASDEAEPTCVMQPAGTGETVRPDTTEHFLSYKPFRKQSRLAPVPEGYVQTFSGLNASNNAYGYMGYTLLPKYDSNDCASKCDAMSGCQAFNLYFERNPSVDPNSPTCSDPPSVTNIKCLFWGGPVTAENAVNTGQYRGSFHVVIAASNGYVNRTISQPADYTEPTFLGDYAINAPPACPGRPSRLLQSNAFVAQAFDVRLCATACSEQAAWAQGREGQRQCKFFNTYLLYRNGAALAQYCAMYDEVWAATYAVNDGYFNGADRYTIGSSYSSWSERTGAIPGDLCEGGDSQ